MIIFVKGQSNVGKTSLSQRLAESLQLDVPAWPISKPELEEWREGIEGWWEAESSFFLEARHIDVDRVVGLILFENRYDFPPPPTLGQNMSRRDFEEWRDRECQKVLTPKYLPRLFELVCGMIESTDHVVINGTALGVSPRDSQLLKMILFKYPQVGHLRILVKRAPYESPDMPVGVPVTKTAVINGRTFTHDQVVDMITRDEQDIIRFSPELGPAPAGAPHALGKSA